MSFVSLIALALKPSKLIHVQLLGLVSYFALCKTDLKAWNSVKPNLGIILEAVDACRKWIIIMFQYFVSVLGAVRFPPWKWFSAVVTSPIKHNSSPS